MINIKDVDAKLIDFINGKARAETMTGIRIRFDEYQLAKHDFIGIYDEGLNVHNKIVRCYLGIDGSEAGKTVKRDKLKDTYGETLSAMRHHFIASQLDRFHKYNKRLSREDVNMNVMSCNPDKLLSYQGLVCAGKCKPSACDASGKFKSISAPVIKIQTFKQGVGISQTFYDYDSILYRDENILDVDTFIRYSKPYYYYNEAALNSLEKLYPNNEVLSYLREHPRALAMYSYGYVEDVRQLLNMRNNIVFEQTRINYLLVIMVIILCFISVLLKLL